MGRARGGNEWPAGWVLEVEKKVGEGIGMAGMSLTTKSRVGWGREATKGS